MTFSPFFFRKKKICKKTTTLTHEINTNTGKYTLHYLLHMSLDILYYINHINQQYENSQRKFQHEKKKKISCTI